jgi:anti-sigma B factor antagonist
MNVNMTTTDTSARIVLSGHVDEQGAEELKKTIRDLDLGQVKDVTIDFREAQRIGSAGIGQLLLLYKNLAVAGGGLTVENLSPTLFELFKGLKLDTLFTLSRV